MKACCFTWNIEWGIKYSLRSGKQDLNPCAANTCKYVFESIRSSLQMLPDVLRISDIFRTIGVS